MEQTRLGCSILGKGQKTCHICAVLAVHAKYPLAVGNQEKKRGIFKAALAELTHCYIMRGEYCNAACFVGSAALAGDVALGTTT